MGQFCFTQLCLCLLPNPVIHKMYNCLPLIFSERPNDDKDPQRQNSGKVKNYLNMMMPPTKVTQSAAPQAVEKLRRWASFNKVESFDEYWPSDFDPKVSGEKIIPTARKATAAKNRVNQAISDSRSVCLFPLSLSLVAVLYLQTGRRTCNLFLGSYTYQTGLSWPNTLFFWNIIWSNPWLKHFVHPSPFVAFLWGPIWSHFSFTGLY